MMMNFLKSSFRRVIFIAIPALLLVALIKCASPEEAPLSTDSTPEAGAEIISQTRVGEVDRTAPVEEALPREIAEFSAEIRRLFEEKDFTFLEEKAALFRESEERFGDGSWKIFRFYEAIEDRPHEDLQSFLADLKTLEEWESAFPESVTQKVTLGGFLVSFARHAGGEDSPSSMTKEQAREREKRLVMAEVILLALDGFREKDPYEAIVAIRLGSEAGWEEERLLEVRETSRKRFPAFPHAEAEAERHFGK